MPELPEVEAVCRILRTEAVGSLIRSVHVLRPRSIHPQTLEDAARAEGAKILRVERRAKNILIPLSNGFSIRIHLGMTGNACVAPDARLLAASVRVLFELKDGRGLVLEDSRVFGRVHVLTGEQVDALDESLGMEPLSRKFTAARLLEWARATVKPAKIFLMDQNVVAGLGNIYSAEALFLARINPRQPMKKIKAEKITALHAAIQQVLRKAIRRTTRAYRKPGYFEDSDFQVYGREGEPCPRCRTAIRRIEQAGRSTYFCPRCQR